ncbi:MAG: MoxR family ATPase [Leptolinea sp.]
MAIIANKPYTGKLEPSENEVKQGKLPYIPSDELVEVVNLTIMLEKRPLLIKGEPGSGKTRLAEAVAYELGLEYEPWYIKSTSRARDGLYTYDAFRRLHDAQLKDQNEMYRQRVANPENYVSYGRLGRAFQNEKRTVVLIDEIDKADIDFPNDLLLELDEQRFYVDEVLENGKPKEIKAVHPPIVIITSNDEKDLPDAFLRRCVFHYIEFPDAKTLEKIVKVHFPEPSKELLEKAIEQFLKLRQNMCDELGKVGKKVSTSELLDWFQVLSSFPEDDILQQFYKNGMPFAGILLKNWEDQQRFFGKTLT